jgi:hypothetical protein
MAAMLSVVGALACSGSDRALVTPPPTRRVPVVKKVAPSEFGREARRPGQALIPGTDAQGRSTSIPLLGRASQVRVEAIWSGATERGLAPVWLTTASHRGQLGAGLHELYGEALATPRDAPPETAEDAPIWRAAVGSAWLAAASALNKDMADLQVRARSDSPHHDISASALLAAGFLASLTGRAVDPSATVIGVINPDGTLGPARDMAARIEQAAGAGKQRVGHAAGMSDAAAVARAPGVEVRALGDVGDAYALLTGGELPAPVLAAERDMQPSPAEVAHLEAGYQAWRGMVSQRWASVVELTGAGNLPGALDRLARAARGEATAAEALWQEQELVLAHDRMMRAAVLVTATVAIWQVIERVQANDMAGAGQRLGELVAAPLPEGDAGDPVPAALRAVADFEPHGLADHLLLIAATQSALRGHALAAVLAAEVDPARAYLATLADSERDRDTAQERSPGQRRGPAGKARAAQRQAERIDGVIARVAPLMLLRARAETESKLAMQTLAAPRPGAPAHVLTSASVRRLAREYAAVAAADMGAFEALYVPGVTDAPGVPHGAERVPMLREPRYLLARKVVAWPQTEPWRELDPRPGQHAPALLLAGSVLAYFEASVLMSAWYSLGVRADQATGLVESVAPDVHLASLLARAERAARQHAFAARVATGSIPVQARLSYQVARSLAGDGGPDHGHAQSQGDQTGRRLRALEMYWASSVTSRLALALARN